MRSFFKSLIERFNQWAEADQRRFAERLRSQDRLRFWQHYDQEQKQARFD